MEDQEKIAQLAHANEILLSYACTNIYEGRSEFDIKQPIEVAMRILQTFLMKLYPQMRGKVIDSMITGLLEMKTKCLSS